MESASRTTGTGRGTTEKAPRRPAPALRAGFSFVEVLFAVMILGIGFIMLAGIFPVAISQTQSTGEEASAANIARSAAAYLENLPGTRSIFNGDGRTYKFDDKTQVQSPGDNRTLWDRVSGNLIVAEDPRYAWVPLYRRGSRPFRDNPDIPNPLEMADLPHDYAEVTIFVLRARNRAAYVASAESGGDLFVNNDRGTLMPRDVVVTLEEGGDNADRIAIVSPNDHPVRTGAFVVIAAGTDVSDRDAAGRIYRVGSPVNEGNNNLFELAPGHDMQVVQPASGPPLRENIANAPAFVIGEGAAGGGAQDVAVYQTFIKLN